MSGQDRGLSNVRSNETLPPASAPIEIDLQDLFGRLLARKWFILTVTLGFMLAGIFVAFTATPIYRGQALLQIEQQEGGVPGLDELSEMFTIDSEAVTEIELLKSRMVLGETVDRLQLDVRYQPRYFPAVGELVAKLRTEEGRLAEPVLNGYAWGGERFDVAGFTVPRSLIGDDFVVQAEGGDRFSLIHDGETLGRGQVGEPLEIGGVSIQLKELFAHPGTRFDLSRKNRLWAIEQLATALNVSEKGQKSGILSVHLDGPNPQRVERILDMIVNTYVRKNVDRNAAEVRQSLDFLREQLPQIRRQLDAAEERLNDYQVSAESVNILAETESLLEQIVSLEEQISALQLREVEVRRQYRPDHPTYMALTDQMEELRARRAEYQVQIKRLPETQQRLLRLRRDVEVNTQIYTQLLNNIQELDILRAGTIGNVRVVDSAEVNTFDPVEPRRPFILAFSTLLGGMLALTIVLVQGLIRRGVENPEEIERIGLPVYAAIPYSPEQGVLERTTTDIASDPEHPRILAFTRPKDIAVEAIRSLRTSIYFAMADASDSIIMMTGPSPFVGKSFVSSNLAVTMAAAGKKVLLVDADMRKGYLHEIFQQDKENGLSEYLSGQAELVDVVRETVVDDLFLLSHGTEPPNPSELLMSARFEELLRQLGEDFDLVIIDTPPVLAVTDAAVVGRYAGTTMMVTRFQSNTLEEIEISLRRLEQNGISVKGCIFNAIQRTHGYGYGYASGYHTYVYGNE